MYSAYFLILSIRSLNDKKFLIQSKYNNFDSLNNFCIIIYSHNNERTLENLVNQLKKQDFPVENFQAYVILDNCSDNSEKLFLNDNFVQVFNVKNQETIGKDQAISVLLEKLSKGHNSNAYIFLDADRHIEADFLKSVNSAVSEAPVITGATIAVGQCISLVDNIKSVFQKYHTNFILKSRSIAGLASTIDSGILVMHRQVMDEIGCVDFQNIDTELKYSLLLSRIGVKCQFNPNIKTYVDATTFELKLPSLISRIKLFQSCFTQIWGKNIIFNEHVLSLLAPNALVLVLGYCCILKHSCNYYFMVDFSLVLLSFTTLLLGFSISLLKSKLKSKEFLFLSLYPIYSLVNMIKKVPLFSMIKNKFLNKQADNENAQKLLVDVTVTDGKGVMPCKLELISEDGLAKVRFIFKRKTFTTSSHLRMVDAISELTTKMTDYGFVLMICQCCKYFTPHIDGSTNMVKGFCSYEFLDKQQQEQIPTLLWNSCKGFCHNKISSVIEEISQII